MPKKRLSNAERRSQIIQVAMDLFANRGFKGATTRAIAETAGVCEAIIFRHFATKEDLYDAIITTTIERRRQAWAQEAPAIDESEDLEPLLKAFALAIIGRNRKDQTFIRLMLYSALEDHKFRQRFFESHRSPYMEVIRNRIQRGVESGEFTKTDPQLTMLSFFWSVLQYSISRFVASPDMPPVEADELFVENLVGVYVKSLISSATPDPAVTA